MMKNYIKIKKIKNRIKFFEIAIEAKKQKIKHKKSNCHQTKHYL